MKTGTRWKQLSQGDRDRIQLLLGRGYLRKEIAEVLEVHPSRITREINGRRKRDGAYVAIVAEHKAKVNRGNSKYQGMKIERNPELKYEIIRQLMELRSPDEIAGRMRKKKRSPRINKDAIYKWLYSSYGERYTKYLCTRRKKKKVQSKKTQREMIPNRIGLEWRPEEGIHAEGDTFLSPKEIRDAVALVGIKEEKHLLGLRISNLKPETMKRAVQKIISKANIDDLTWDNGIENKKHEEFGIPSYFCDPHAPWQKGFIEGSIGLIRRWFIPKGTDLREVSQEQLDCYLNVLNNKYRRSLGYQSSMELVIERGILKDIKKEIAIQPRI